MPPAVPIVAGKGRAVRAFPQAVPPVAADRRLDDFCQGRRQAGHRPGNVRRVAHGADRRRQRPGCRGPSRGRPPVSPIIATVPGSRVGAVSPVVPIIGAGKLVIGLATCRGPQGSHVPPAAPIDAGNGRAVEGLPRGRAARAADRRLGQFVQGRRASWSSTWQRVAVPPVVPIDGGKGRAVEGLPRGRAARGAVIDAGKPVIDLARHGPRLARAARGADRRRQGPGCRGPSPGRARGVDHRRRATCSAGQGGHRPGNVPRSPAPRAAVSPAVPIILRRQAGHRPGNVSRAFPAVVSPVPPIVATVPSGQGGHRSGNVPRSHVAPCRPWCRSSTPASRSSTWQRVEGLPRGRVARGADHRRRQRPGCRGPSPRPCRPCRRSPVTIVAGQAGHRPGNVPRSPGLARAAAVPIVAGKGRAVEGLPRGRAARGADHRRRQAGHRPGNVAPCRRGRSTPARAGLSRAFPRGRAARRADRRRGLAACRQPAARAVSGSPWCRRSTLATWSSTWQRVEGLPRGGPRGADDRR